MTSNEMLNRYKEQIISFYGPQLGELAWHSLHYDHQIVHVSEQHAKEIIRAAEYCNPMPDGPIRILEVGAYAHYGASKAASVLGGFSVAHDISPRSLRKGREGAEAAGLDDQMSVMVAGDFHDLPFSTGYFDVVFCASSVHHTDRPVEVIKEMLRVIRKGGVLFMQNEPVERLLCFNGFHSNRHDQYTPFEAELDKRGLLFTLSSPFPGTRSEKLFGMIENDRIPLDLMFGTLKRSSEIAYVELVPKMGDLENKVLAMVDDEDIETSLATFLIAEIEAVKPLLTERDILMGIRLPDVDEIWQLSRKIAWELSQLRGISGREAEEQMARIFGGALLVIARKKQECEVTDDLFKREAFLDEGVFNDFPSLPGVHLQLSAPNMPMIEDGDVPELAKFYDPKDWDIRYEKSGIWVCVNVNDRGHITLPPQTSPAILMLRFYFSEGVEPYRVNIYQKDRTLLFSFIVTQSESVLFRELVQENCGEVFVETSDLNYGKKNVPDHVRIGVGRLIPVRFSGEL